MTYRLPGNGHPSRATAADPSPRALRIGGLLPEKAAAGGLDPSDFSTKVPRRPAAGHVQPNDLALCATDARRYPASGNGVRKNGGTAVGIIVWLIIGAIAGWLAGLIVKGAGFGLVGNIVIGIIGAVVAGWLLPQLGVRLGAGLVGEIIDAAIGGVIVLVILSFIRR
jgi:uncharacterized membrane protein YeaQ/YmgE (transglycosylase-associated protein family)